MERTTMVGRVVEIVRDRAPVAVVGHPCPWRDDLVDVLAQRLGRPVAPQDAVPDAAGAVVWLEVSAREARFEQVRHDWERSGGRARGEPMLAGATWTASSDGAGSDEDDDEVGAPDGVDIVFVPVSGVRAPRLLRVFYDWSDHLLWDEGYRYLGHLETLLPLSAGLRSRLTAFVRAVDASVDHQTSMIGHPAMDEEERALAEAVAEELAGEFVVEAGLG